MPARRPGTPARRPAAPGQIPGLPALGRTGRWFPPVACCAALLVAAAACSAGASSPPRHHTAPPSAHTPAAAGVDQDPLALAIAPAAYQLPSGISREVLLPQGGDLLIAGGLTQQGTTTGAVTRLDPVTGRTTPAGQLASPTHDAAGAVLGGQPYVFGGGVTASVAAIQALRPGPRAGRATVAGQLPAPRSDLSAVSVGATSYLIGGYDGASYDPAVLATSDGTHFRVAARLPVPVRYAAVAAAAGRIWVFGGETATGDTSAIQEINVATGKATIVGHVPAPMSGATGFSLGGQIFIAGGQVAKHGTLVTSDRVLGFIPGQHQASVAGRLPVRVTNAASAVLGGTAFVVGGNDGQRQVPTVTQVRLAGAAPSAAVAQEPISADPPGSDANPAGPSASPSIAAGVGITDATGSPILANAPWLGPPLTKGHLRPGSNPAVLPGDVLIADDWNNRLLIVDPLGRIRWEFPRPGDLARGQTFLLPDDAFFSPNAKYIIATEEENSVISVISIARHKIVYRYGTPGVPGSTANHVSNPDDAMMLPGGSMIAADIKNCRLLLLSPPARQRHRPHRVIGGSCWHNPPQGFGSPNGAFPATNGDYIVTEINGDWADKMSLSGHLKWSTHPPGVAYPSDTNEVFPGRYLTADYSPAGQVVEFNSRGRLLWRFGGLNHPSLALPLPNGDILVNDDYNDRVIVIDPTLNRIVWQYGHTGVASTAPGYLNDPDGVDVTPPDSMLIVHAPTMGRP